MRTWLRIGLLGAALCLAGLGSGAGAAPATTPPPAHHGLLGRLHRTGSKTMSGGPVSSGSHRALRGGSIIGNKRTHVYHLPGDTGNMPEEKNRVYFRTVAEAEAAGYRAAGKSAAGKSAAGSMGRHTRATGTTGKHTRTTGTMGKHTRATGTTGKHTRTTGHARPITDGVTGR